MDKWTLFLNLLSDVTSRKFIVAGGTIWYLLENGVNLQWETILGVVVINVCYLVVQTLIDYKETVRV